MKLIHLTASILVLVLTNALPLDTSVVIGLEERQCNDVAEGCPPPGSSNDTDPTPIDPIFNPINITWPVGNITEPIFNITWPVGNITDPFFSLDDETD